MSKKLAIVLMAFAFITQQVGSHLAFMPHGARLFGLVLLILGTLLFALGVIRVAMPADKVPQGPNHRWWCFLRIFMRGRCGHQ